MIAQDILDQNCNIRDWTISDDFRWLAIGGIGIDLRWTKKIILKEKKVIIHTTSYVTHIIRHDSQTQSEMLYSHLVTRVNILKQRLKKEADERLKSLKWKENV